MQGCISCAQNSCEDLELSWRCLLINNDDGCDKAHATTVVFSDIASVRYGEVTTDKRASSSLAFISPWYCHHSVSPKSVANVLSSGSNHLLPVPRRLHNPATVHRRPSIPTQTTHSCRSSINIRTTTSIRTSTPFPPLQPRAKRHHLRTHRLPTTTTSRLAKARTRSNSHHTP